VQIDYVVRCTKHFSEARKVIGTKTLKCQRPPLAIIPRIPPNLMALQAELLDMLARIFA